MVSALFEDNRRIPKITEYVWCVGTRSMEAGESIATVVTKPQRLPTTKGWGVYMGGHISEYE